MKNCRFIDARNLSSINLQYQRSFQEIIPEEPKETHTFGSVSIHTITYTLHTQCNIIATVAIIIETVHLQLQATAMRETSGLELEVELDFSFQ